MKSRTTGTARSAGGPAPAEAAAGSSSSGHPTPAHTHTPHRRRRAAARTAPPLIARTPIQLAPPPGRPRQRRPCGRPRPCGARAASSSTGTCWRRRPRARRRRPGECKKRRKRGCLSWLTTGACLYRSNCSRDIQGIVIVWNSDTFYKRLISNLSLSIRIN